MLQRRNIEIERLGLQYDPLRGKKRDVTNPHGWELRKKIQQDSIGNYIVTDKAKKLRDEAFKNWQPIRGVSSSLFYYDSNGEPLSKPSTTIMDRLRPRTTTVEQTTNSISSLTIDEAKDMLKSAIKSKKLTKGRPKTVI